MNQSANRKLTPLDPLDSLHVLRWLINCYTNYAAQYQVYIYSFIPPLTKYCYH